MDRVPFHTAISEGIRWDLIDILARSYAVGVCDEDRPKWFERFHSLSDDEREVLKWKMDEGDAALTLLLKTMKENGANTIADLCKKAPD